MAERARRGFLDAAASDTIGTLLMVLAVVVLGGAVAVVTSATLAEEAPPAASLALAPLAPADARLDLVLRNGEPIPLSDLRLQIEREGAGAQDVPRSSWLADGRDALRAGERLGVPLVPAAAEGETIRLRAFRVEANVLLAELAAAATGADAGAASAATLSLALSPASIRADGASAARLEATVSHAAGALGVARVSANLTTLALASATAAELVLLRDDGLQGDAIGGDGVWSALVRAPTSTPDGVYAIPVAASDAQGRLLATASADLTIASGSDAVQGTTFAIPSSSAISQMRLSGFVVDRLYPARLDNDVLVLHVADAAGHGWTATLALEDVGGVAYATTLRLYGDASDTTYAPRNGTRLPLASLDMDLLDPVASLQWSRSAGAAHPTALYASAGIGDGARLTVTRMGDERSLSATDIGIFAADVVVR